jgi:hypothetical protein
MVLIVSVTLLQAQRPAGGSNAGSVSAGSSRAAAAPHAAVHSSGGQGYRTVITGGPFPGRFNGYLRGRPYRRGYGSVWMPWPAPYWADDYYADESSDLESVNAPPQAGQHVVVVEYREPTRPTPPREGPKVTEVTTSKEASPGKPQAPTVFVLTDGEKLESHEYLLTASSLRIDVGRQRRIIPVRQLNIDASLAANHERGIELTFPRNSGTIFLGF